MSQDIYGRQVFTQQNAAYLEITFPGMTCYRVMFEHERMTITEAQLFHMAASGFFEGIRIIGFNCEVQLDLGTREKLHKFAIEGYRKAMKQLLEQPNPEVKP